MEINNAVGHMAISSESGSPNMVCALLKIHKCVPRCVEEMAFTGPVSGGQLPEPGSVNCGWFRGKRIQEPES